MKKLLICSVALLLASCATIMRDNKDTVAIKSNVEDVDIKILNQDGECIFEGKTPTTTVLKTSQVGYFSPEKYKVIATKNGYKTQMTEIDWHVSTWYIAGNLVFGGLLGYLIIDPISGDMYYLDSEKNINMSSI